jgi:hypothetical protein
MRVTLLDVSRSLHATRRRWAAVATMAAGYAAFFWITRDLWQVPSGSDIRPMGMAAAMFVLGIGTPVAVMIVSNFAPQRETADRRLTRVADLAFLASFGVLVLTFIYIPLVAWLRGLQLSG